MPDSTPVPQSVLMQRILPLIEDKGERYRKCRQVHARPAKPGETVVTVTSAGRETRSRAGENAWVVKNLTGARECYVVSQENFLRRYFFAGEVDGRWKRYQAMGEVLALAISPALCALLGVGKRFSIMAPWGSEEVAEQGDMLVTPLPERGEVYRVARREFRETYRRIA